MFTDFAEATEPSYTFGESTRGTIRGGGESGGITTLPAVTTSSCGALTTCFLLDIETGKQLEVTPDRPTMGLESILDSHTLVSETVGHIDTFIFKVPGLAPFEDKEMPWSMAGRDPSTGVFSGADHILDAGKKSITVVGTYQGKECFKHRIDMEVSEGMESPDDRRRLVATNSNAVVGVEQNHRHLCPCVVAIIIVLILT